MGGIIIIFYSFQCNISILLKNEILESVIRRYCREYKKRVILILWEGYSQFSSNSENLCNQHERSVMIKREWTIFRLLFLERHSLSVNSEVCWHYTTPSFLNEFFCLCSNQLFSVNIIGSR